MNFVGNYAIHGADVFGLVDMLSVRECFAFNLKKRLVTSGLTQKKFAALIGTTETSVSRWLQARELPIAQTIDLICTKLNMNPWDLFRNPDAASMLDEGKIVIDLERIAAESGYIIKKKDS